MDIFSQSIPGAHLESLRLERTDGVFHTALCLASPPWPALRDGRSQFLHAQEAEYFSRLKFERRQKTYLVGRYCAKEALLLLRPDVLPTSFAISPGVFQQPIVHGPGGNLQVSLSHTESWGAAIAFPEEHPMAIDIEELNPERVEAIRTQVTGAECAAMARFFTDETRALSLLWTAKEAMAKVIRCGMMTPFKMFEVASVELAGRSITCTFANFGQYKATCYLLEEMALSLVSPKNSSFRSALEDRALPL